MKRLCHSFFYLLYQFPVVTKMNVPDVSSVNAFALMTNVLFVMSVNVFVIFKETIQ
jgi:hypothetical protein